ncbi:hypothetical protein LCGC14_0765400 [marine sediment metagenome]|uniref:DUF362 domain-containing protein n=1 Tax=marine sediment metagenome TaxID=412755 RepID=A0A0F9Q445_9ZZZZ
MRVSVNLPTNVQKVGNMTQDISGSHVAVVRMYPDRAYIGIPELLKKVIDESNVESWRKICEKIDYIYKNLDYIFTSLEKETTLKDKLQLDIKNGKILLFKPNIVNPIIIDPITHDEGIANSVSTEWPLIAALMRWIHDKFNISYHQMALGEAATLTSMYTGLYNISLDLEGKITTEAIIEGRSGDFYGGWGFYFVRRYLAENHQPSHDDDPMNGYEESVSGTYLPPGRADNKLMVYDLNRVSDIKGKARTIPVPDGINFKEITLHKVVVGGEPDNPEDITDYPGCILINVPRLKLHITELLTNAIKNLGMGLYPMQAAEKNDPQNTRWKYSFPFDIIPGLKTELPHEIWHPKWDDETNLPLRDQKGDYLVNKTGGMYATQSDMIKGIVNQDILMIHIVDAIQTVNLSHTGSGIKVPEGLIFASLDPVALDLLCARYCFKMVPMQEARELRKKMGLRSDFLQRVSIPRVEGQNISSVEGFDSPLPRYNLYKYAESRGLGQEKYYVKGWDAIGGVSLVSTQGHLGWFEDGEFRELITSEFYYNPGSMIWGLQKTVIAYLEANDLLTGSSYRRMLFDVFDENHDGIIDYDEKGKIGCSMPLARLRSIHHHIQGTERYGFLRGPFISAGMMKYEKKEWNAQGHNFTKDFQLSFKIAMAYNMSRMQSEKSDPFFPRLTWGNGKWPSLQYAFFFSISIGIYGPRFPSIVSNSSLYGLAFQYADKKLNKSYYTGNVSIYSNPEAVNRYIQAVREGADQLDFVVYVPKGFGKFDGKSLPNVVETDDPHKIFMGIFDNCQEVWQ